MHVFIYRITISIMLCGIPMHQLWAAMSVWPSSATDHFLPFFSWTYSCGNAFLDFWSWFHFPNMSARNHTSC
jgi:hypothetical protein